MDPILRAQLIRDEGYRLTAYKDSLGYWTIGIGHYLGPGPSPRVLSITKPECEAWYVADVQEAGATLARFIPNPLAVLTLADGMLDDARHRALHNMAFNLGGRLSQFKRFLSAINAKDWEQAAKEMLASKWATQVGARAERLAHTIRTGEE